MAIHTVRLLVVCADPTKSTMDTCKLSVSLYNKTLVDREDVKYCYVKRKSKAVNITKAC